MFSIYINIPVALTRLSKTFFYETTETKELKSYSMRNITNLYNHIT